MPSVPGPECFPEDRGVLRSLLSALAFDNLSRGGGSYGTSRRGSLTKRPLSNKKRRARRRDCLGRYTNEDDTVDENENEIEPCATCSGIGYRGRTGLFELLVLNDELRAALASNPKKENLAAIAKKHQHVSLQMEGIVMVAGGRTSIEELQRVLKA